MPISYTNRKGVAYTLYRGQTRTGKPRYNFGRADKGEGEPVMELPPGFKISESVNGVVSLVKERPSLIQPEEMAVIEAVMDEHPRRPGTGSPSSTIGSRSTRMLAQISMLCSTLCI